MHEVQDVRYPYEDAASRVALLYALPGPAGPKRLLIVGAGDRARSLAAAWDGPVQVLPAGSARQLDGAAGFDVLAFLGALPERAADASHGLLLRALAPGGWVVGDVPHGWSPRRLRRDGLAAMWPGRRAAATPAGCLASLRGAGLRDAACFYVQPNLDAPMGLIPCDRRAARQEFLRRARSTEGLHGRASYALRWLVAWSGLGGLQQTDLFYWARKPC